MIKLNKVLKLFCSVGNYDKFKGFSNSALNNL